MVKRMSLNDDQFRQIMVRGNAYEDRDREVFTGIDRSNVMINQCPVKQH